MLCLWTGGGKSDSQLTQNHWSIAIAHLLNRDYTEIGQDFINLDFIPEGTDTRPIVPALTKVFDAALAGGGAKSINFQELAADLAEITFEYVGHVLPVVIVQCLLSHANCLMIHRACAPLIAFQPFRIPPYFALVIRAIGVVCSWVEIVILLPYAVASFSTLFFLVELLSTVGGNSTRR